MSRRPGRRWTLRGRLSRNVLSAVALGWAVMIALALVALDHEMNEVLDDEMEAIVGLSVQFFDGSDNQAIPQMLGFEEEEGEKALRILRAGGPVPDAPWGLLTRDGFSDLDGWRVLRQSTGGTIIEIGQSKAWRREEMLESAGFFLALMAGQLVLLLLVIRRAVNASMEPVDRFARSIAGRRPDDMSVLPADNLAEELAPLARALNDYLDRIRDLRDAERQFVANAAHELRTPLATARARLQLDGTEAGRAVIVTLDAMARRVERLLQLSRAEAVIGQSGGPTDLRRVLRLLIGEAERRFHQPVAFDDDGTGSPILPIDPDALAILLTNLLENAVQHGTGNVRVTLGPDLRLAMSNDVAEGAEFHLGRFRKGNSSKGSGLGLAIAQMIAKDLGVALDWSIRGGRATVVVDLSSAATGG